MTSGYSWGGGRSRCFTHWQEFQKCYIQTDNPQECQPQSSEYLECLHHRKEIKHTEAVRAELSRRLKHEQEEAEKHGKPISGGLADQLGLASKGKSAEEDKK